MLTEVQPRGVRHRSGKALRQDVSAGTIPALPCQPYRLPTYPAVSAQAQDCLVITPSPALLRLQISKAKVEVEAKPWQRIEIGGQAHDHGTHPRSPSAPKVPTCPCPAHRGEGGLPGRVDITTQPPNASKTGFRSGWDGLSQPEPVP